MEQIDLNNIDIKLKWPIIARFNDDYFPYNGYDHIRYTARALLENQDGKFAFLHIVGEDFFGVRDHLETCGGGLEEGEKLDETIVREVKEEVGLDIIEYELVGSILDAYNLINRITLSTFFHCKVDNNNLSKVHRTYEEEVLIKEILWLDPDEALDRLKNSPKSNVDKIVQRRDFAALEYYLNHKKS